MGVLLLILKYIGFLLLFLLVFAVILILTAVFSPISYSIESENKDGFCHMARISALFKIIAFTYQDSTDSSEAKVIIFGRRFDLDTVLDFFTKDRKPKKNKKGKKDKKDIDKDREDARSKDARKTSYKDKTDSDKSKTEKKQKKQSKKGEGKKISDKKGGFGQTVNTLKYIYSYFVSIENKKEICDYSIEFLKGIIKAFKNNVFDVYVKFGFSEPDHTGTVLGAASVVNAFLPVTAIIEADFERKCFLYKVRIKGRTSAFRLAVPSIKFILKEPIWNIIFDRKEDNK